MADTGVIAARRGKGGKIYKLKYWKMTLEVLPSSRLVRGTVAEILTGDKIEANCSANI